MLRKEAIKKAKSIAKRIKDIVYVILDNNYGYEGYFTLTQNQYDSHTSVEENDIVLGFDQYGRAV